MVDKKTFTIGVLSLSAVILLVANLIAPRPASATFESVQDNDYLMQTATSPKGSDVVWVTDKRSGKTAVLGLDPNQKKLALVDRQPIQFAFAKLLKK